MKSRISAKEPKFPILAQHGVNKAFIVLFVDEHEGCVVLSDDTTRPVGSHRKDWIFDSFIPFSGSVTLSND